MAPTASSAMRTESAAIRRFVSITSCTLSRISSLWAATKARTERQPAIRFRPSMFLVSRFWAERNTSFEMLWGGRWRDVTIVAGSNADGASYGTAVRRFEAVPHAPRERQHDQGRD